MSKNSDYVHLNALLSHPGWQVLESLWLAQISDIEEKRDGAAKRGQESAWRYWAGLEKGFKMAIMQPKIALSQMESDEENKQGEERIDALLEEIKGEIKQ